MLRDLDTGKFKAVYIVCGKGKRYYHTAFYMGGGKYADSSKTHRPNIKAG